MPDDVNGVEVSEATEGAMPEVPVMTPHTDFAKQVDGGVVVEPVSEGVAFKPSGLGGTVSYGGPIGSFAGTMGTSSVLSGGNVQVNTDELRAAAERGTTAINQLLEAIETVKADVARSADGWDSPGGDYFREVFAKRCDRFTQVVEEFAGYTGELVAYADQHEGISSIADQLGEDAASAAEQVKDAHWVNVSGGYA